MKKSPKPYTSEDFEGLDLNQLACACPPELDGHHLEEIVATLRNTIGKSSGYRPENLTPECVKSIRESMLSKAFMAKVASGTLKLEGQDGDKFYLDSLRILAASIWNLEEGNVDKKDLVNVAKYQGVTLRDGFFERTSNAVKSVFDKAVGNFKN